MALFRRGQYLFEGVIEKVGFGQSSVHYGGDIDLCFGADGVVGGAYDALVEDVEESFFFYLIDGGLKDLGAVEGAFEAHFDACYHGVEPLFVKLEEIESVLFEKFVARHFEKVLVVGVVYVSLCVALVVAHFHFKFKKRLIHFVFIDFLSVCFIFFVSDVFLVWAKFLPLHPFGEVQAGEEFENV